VAAAGHYGSGSEARQFYLELATELDQACEARSIPCRSKGHTFSPVVDLSQAPELAANFGRGAQNVVKLESFSIDPWDPPSNAPLALYRDYESVVGSVYETFGQHPRDENKLNSMVLLAIARAYQTLLRYLIALAALCVVFTLARQIVKRRTYVSEHAVLFIGVGLSVATLLAFLTVIETLSFPAFNDEYLSSLYPPLMFAAAFSLFAAGAVLRRWILRRFGSA
jgi:hypothetical protein